MEARIKTRVLDRALPAFQVVRESVREALAGVALDVRVDREKSVLKQAAVQHLYGRLSAVLRPDCGDAELMVSYLSTCDT